MIRCAVNSRSVVPLNALLTFFLCSAILSAQQTSGPQKPAEPQASASSPAVATFRAQADLVFVPVVVKDRKGKPVGGLSKDAFRLVNGGCANGDQGNVTGYSVGAFNGSWYGELTTAGGVDIHWGTDQLGQVGPSSEGSFGLTGTFNFDGACFNSGKLTPGTYPTPSFILGTSVALNIPTDNGTIAFVGTAGPDEGGLIEGTYTVTGGSCESTGTGYLSPWEY